MAETDQIYTSDHINKNFTKFYKKIVLSTQNYLIHKDKNGIDNLLLIIRSDHGDFGSELCAPGGKHDINIDTNIFENGIEAGEREAFEEVGIRVYGSKKFGVYHNPRGFLINTIFNFISDEDLKNVQNYCRKEVAAVCLIPVDKLREYAQKPEYQQVSIKYNEERHQDRFRETGGFKVSTPIVKISRVDLRIIAGSTELNELILRPQGFLDLDRSVLAQGTAKLVAEMKRDSSKVIMEACYKLSTDPFRIL